MNTRRASVDVTWNGVSATEKLRSDVTGFTYKDPASGEADSLDITVHDRSRKWIGPWLPQKGDTLSASIQVSDWTSQGDNRRFYCGYFILDDFSFSGPPVSGSISAVSVPADSSFRETQRSKTWEEATIKEIAEEVASRAGVSLQWDVEEEFVLQCVEQSNQTDCEFLMQLCEEYGYCMKVYAWKIVIFDREAYKAKAAVRSYQAGELQSWNWKTTMAGTYTGGEYTYTDPQTEEEIVVKVGKGPRILKQSGKADSKADAERKIKAAVANANHGATTLSATIMGDPGRVASQCVEVLGLGKLSGKYYIDSITSKVGGGFTQDLEMSLVE